MDNTSDSVDMAIISVLQNNARRSISDIALDVGASRATVRSRIDKLVASGEIAGFTVRLKSELRERKVRAMTMIEVEGKVSDRVATRLRSIAEVVAVHTTNGRWDLIAEIHVDDLQQFDEVLRGVRLIDGIAQTESNLLLRTLKQTRA